VIWVLDHLEDIESDFSVFHRIDDPWSMPGPKFFRFALRLPAYAGVMAARVMAEQEKPETVSRGRPTEDRKVVPLSSVETLHPDLIERSSS
jgi:hypothetical protein